jgi:hypothetical protein
MKVIDFAQLVVGRSTVALSFCLSMIFRKTGLHPRGKPEGMVFRIML